MSKQEFRYTSVRLSEPLRIDADTYRANHRISLVQLVEESVREFLAARGALKKALTKNRKGDVK